MASYSMPAPDMQLGADLHFWDMKEMSISSMKRVAFMLRIPIPAFHGFYKNGSPKPVSRDYLMEKITPAWHNYLDLLI